ncbi:hypothetical protein ACOI1C_12125 [Bacillus sp. DJP31]|uniref:hypothetical protein n=1 Tax=Bacillus sp. DJP31 TaxID=3409789 RepID=UPI003BB69C6A
MVRRKTDFLSKSLQVRDFTINDKESDIFLYSVKGYKKDYIVFGDGEWIVIVGEDAMMETSFQIEGDYSKYLSMKKGYMYLG